MSNQNLSTARGDLAKSRRDVSPRDAEKKRRAYNYRLALSLLETGTTRDRARDRLSRAAAALATPGNAKSRGEPNE